MSLPLCISRAVCTEIKQQPSYLYWDDFNTIKQLSCLSRKRAKAKMFAWEEANQCNSQVIWTERKWQPCCLRLSVLNTVLQLSCLDSWSVWAEMSYLQCTSQAVFPERSTSQAVCDETGLLQHTSWAVFTGKVPAELFGPRWVYYSVLAEPYSLKESTSWAVCAEMILLLRTSRPVFTEGKPQPSCLR